MKKGFWEDGEVKDLFLTVEDMKELNKPLKDAFIAHAQKYSRKPNSVRNYYYYQLEQLKNDIARTKQLGIDLSRHEKTEVEYFSQEDEDKLIKSIDKMVASGMSIRKACYSLSNGNVNLMLRYQNKYRNYLTKNTPQVPDNIITFKKKSVLTDSDINSLFLGLVRLVKRAAMEEATSKKQFEIQSANNSLRKMLVDMGKKEKELEKLKADLSKLKAQNADLVKKMLKLECEKASNLAKQ